MVRDPARVWRISGWAATAPRNSKQEAALTPISTELSMERSATVAVEGAQFV